MKNNKIVIYIGILTIGLVLGWLLFGSSPRNNIEHNYTEVSEDGKMWTCSMHPQIMQPEPGDCPICGMDLIPVETNDVGLAADQFKMTNNAIALANIETTILTSSEKSNANGGLKLSGKIIANDNTTAIQAAHFGGRIEKLIFKSEGEYVSNGTLIASIYSPDLVTAQNELIEALDIKNEQPELYKAVRNKLKYWKISEQQIQNLERTKRVVNNFNMYATTNGFIEKMLVEEGNHVKEGASLFKVTNLNTVWAQLDVYEQDVKRLSLNQDIVINLNAYPDEIISAKIDYISPILNNDTRTVTVRATLINPKGKLKPGMLISGLVKLDETIKDETISVPKSAVMWTGKRSIVYVKTSNEEPVFELREVQVGASVGSNFLILSGLNPNDEIVTNGTFTVDAAAQLQGKRSMMNHINANKSNQIKIERLQAPEPFQKQLKKVVDSYLLLKDDLVNDKASSSVVYAKKILVDLNNVDMTLLTSKAAHNQWMSLLNEIKTSANFLSKANDIESQRKHFKPLSSSLTKVVELFGINRTVYSQFCPMADNDKGAFWLSLNEEIRNPYFGDAMLECGSVKQTIE
ncbi:efflux RND transporter periplasmic adaptor subunit [Pontimicrobium sp. SW4]|uniref:Efflux RND transporter periplasmic adaptor subunit n=1 Tax=Pontimicrobium sp. SW4 TaxID=3153519 RepID=A0AAU7BQ52_9FLAO